MPVTAPQPPLQPQPGLPLAGVTVVAFEQAVAAPYCTRLLADLGARVIKIEQPGTGDFTRHFDAAASGLATHFVWLNRNKESLALDCKRAEARPVLDRLLASADVVVQNLAPGAAQRLGVDAESLVHRYPAMVAADLSGYGIGGPLDHRRAYDLLVQSEGGSCAVTGTEGAPAKPGIPIADVGTGLQAATSILAALVGRGQSGNGAVIRVSMFDTVIDFLGFALLYTSYTGEVRPPNGMSSPVVSPYGAYPTKDGRTVVIGTTHDGEWQRLAGALLHRPDLAADPSLATNAQRLGQRDRLDAAIADWTRTHDLAEVCSLADAAGIGSAAYNNLDEVVDHPQLTTRGRWQQVDSPIGQVASLLPAFTSPQWTTPLRPVPALGEHTAAIISELGFPAGFTDQLRAAGAA
jgi:itaconate CoA-transferase